MFFGYCFISSCGRNWLYVGYLLSVGEELLQNLCFENNLKLHVFQVLRICSCVAWVAVQ